MTHLPRKICGNSTTAAYEFRAVTRRLGLGGLVEVGSDWSRTTVNVEL